MYILGIITGILLSLVVFTAVLYKKNTIDRIIRNTEAKLAPKGSILEPEDEFINNWVESLPKE